MFYLVFLVLCAIIGYELVRGWRKKQRTVIAQHLSQDMSQKSFQTGAAFMLPTGRLLGYRIHGVQELTDPALKRLVIYLHGTPGSRHEVFPDASLLLERGIQLIAIDRPGFGRSTYDPERTRISFAEDIAQLLNGLGLITFLERQRTPLSMIGFSGGGAYTLACLAHPLLRKFIQTATLIASEGPYVDYEPNLLSSIRRHSPILWISSYIVRMGYIGRELLRCYFEYEQYSFFANQRAFIKRKYGARIGSHPSNDLSPEQLQQHHALYEMLVNLHGSVWLEPFQSAGVKAAVHDCFVAKSPWEFQLEDVGDQTQLIAYWHGKKDTLRSYEVSQYMSKRMKKAKNVVTHLIPNAGHALFLRRDNWIEMLDELCTAGVTQDDRDSQSGSASNLIKSYGQHTQD